MEPVLRPMGVDWRVGVGLISAFAAREVFVSSMAIVFHVDSDDEQTQQEGLLKQMNSATFPGTRADASSRRPASSASLCSFSSRFSVSRPLRWSGRKWVPGSWPGCNCSSIRDWDTPSPSSAFRLFAHSASRKEYFGFNSNLLMN